MLWAFEFLMFRSISAHMSWISLTLGQIPTWSEIQHEPPKGLVTPWYPLLSIPFRGLLILDIDCHTQDWPVFSDIRTLFPFIFGHVKYILQALYRIESA